MKKKKNISERVQSPTHRKDRTPKISFRTPELHSPKSTSPNSHSTDEQLITGRKPLLELLRFTPQRVRRMLMTESTFTWFEQQEVQAWNALAPSIQRVSTAELDHYTSAEGISITQGCIAFVTPRPAYTEQDLQTAARKCSSPSILIGLAHVTDPQNLGTVLRAAECFSAMGVVVPRARSASLSPAVRKASAGSSELVDLYEVANLHRVMTDLQPHGFWSVVADVGEGAVPLGSFEFPEKTFLILGSEGEGVPRLLRERADFRVYIPMTGRIDSLNVSQASAVLLWSFCHGMTERR